MYQQHAGACQVSGGTQGQPWRCGGPWPSWPAACWPCPPARRRFSWRRPGCSTSSPDRGWSGAEYEWNARCRQQMRKTRHLSGFTMAVKETIVLSLTTFLPQQNTSLDILSGLTKFPFNNVFWYSVKVGEVPVQVFDATSFSCWTKQILFSTPLSLVLSLPSPRCRFIVKKSVKV